MKLERVRFVHGQRLRADDLSDAAGGELRRQQLHVVGAHDTWGIAEGLQVSARTTGAGVREGAAFDRCGRVLRLKAETAVLAGALDEPVVLVLDGNGVRFVAAADLRLGDEVPLACFTPDAGKLGPADLTCRRYARTSALVRVATGVAHIDIDGNKAWPASGFVDTSVGGFVRSPSYVITQVAGDAPEGLVWIENPQPDGFTAFLWGPVPATDDCTLELTWLGAEPPQGCPPVPRMKELR